MLTDIEREYAVARAEAQHRLRYGHMGSSAPQFTADAASAAIADAIRTKVHDSARQMRFDADPLNNPSYRHGADVMQRALMKDSLSKARRR
jgi:hypothetical protein